MKLVNDSKDMLRENAKFFVALVVGVIVLVLKKFDFPVDQTLQDSLGVLVLAALVWFVPNKK